LNRFEGFSSEIQIAEVLAEPGNHVATGDLQSPTLHGRLGFTPLG
jgi:hypothetical protein